MRKAISIVALLVLACVPARPLETSALSPAEVVFVDTVNGDVIVKTDTGNAGYGATVKEAMEDLQRKAVYLRTARYLILTRSAECYIEEVKEYLPKRIDTQIKH